MLLAIRKRHHIIYVKQKTKKNMFLTVTDILSALGSTVVIVFCWTIGRFGLSSLWLWLTLGLNFIKTKSSNQREERHTALQLLAVKEKEVVTAQLQDLPAWVLFPDTERVEWLNKIAFQLWPFIGEYARRFITEKVEPQIKASMPGPFKSFKFEEIDMGSIPVRITGIKTYTQDVGGDRIIVDVDLVYAGDCNFNVSVGAFEAGLEKVRFIGNLRLIMTPLLAQPPIVGGIRAFFLDDPEIEFDLTGVGQLTELPGLRGAIRDVVSKQVQQRCVLPNEIIVPLASDVDISTLFFAEPDGVLIIHVIEARNLEPLDVGFLKKGKSDPYATFTVGSQFFKTAVVDSNLNPVWNEYFEAAVGQAAGQKLIVNLLDRDTCGDDEPLGFLQIDIEPIQKKGTDKSWHLLEGAKQGELHLDLHWLNLSSDPETSLSNTWAPSNKNLHTAVLMVYIDRISGLPRIRRNADPHPLVEMTVGNVTKRTLPRADTRNPVFQNKYVFWLQDPSSQVLNVEARDADKDRSLGEVAISIQNILKEENMEMNQETWLLTLPTNVAKIILTLRIRILTSTLQER